MTTTPLQEAAAACFRQVHQAIAAATPGNDWLMGGRLGLCLYYHQLHRVLGDDRFATMAVDLLESVIEGSPNPAEQLRDQSLGLGLTGLGYTINLLQQGGYIDMDEEDIMELIDNPVFEIALQVMTPHQQHDYIHNGAMGMLHYFTQRLYHPQVKEYAATLARAVCGNFIQAPGGGYFRNILLPDDKPGRVDFGLSHGNTGFLLVLMDLYEKGVEIEAIPAIVEQTMQLMLQYRQPPSQDSLFPYTVYLQDGKQETSARLAWCYGDLNIIAALYRAAHFLQKPAWKQLADELGLLTLQRDQPSTALLEDAHFCHGTAGVVQLYRHLHQLSGRPEYAQAAGNWVQHTIQFIQQQLPAGYYAGKECSLLDGLVGVNMVLISYLHEEVAEWDNIFLL